MLLNKLTGNLRSQIEAHNNLLETLMQETELPANCAIEELEAIHQLRDKTVVQIKKLELKRQYITQQYFKKYQLPEPISLKSIIEHSTGSYQKVLQQQREQLTTIINKISEVGEQNASRATARIACFSEIQGAVNKALKRSPTYSFHGILNKPKGACLMQKSV